MTKAFRPLIGDVVYSGWMWRSDHLFSLLYSQMYGGPAWEDSQMLWTSQTFKTTLGAARAADPSIKQRSWGFPFLTEERFPISSKLLPPHRVGDYIEARTGTLCLPICFFYLKTPPSFSIIFSISRMTWRENLASEGSMQSRLSPHPPQPTPTCTPILHIALVYKRDVPPPYSHSPPAPSSFGPVPYFPPTIASPVTIIFLFHWPAPRG